MHHPLVPNAYWHFCGLTFEQQLVQPKGAGIHQRKQRGNAYHT